MVDQLSGDTDRGPGKWQSRRPQVPAAMNGRDRRPPHLGEVGAEDSARKEGDIGKATAVSPAWWHEGNERRISQAAGNEGPYLQGPADMASVGYHWENSDVLVFTISGEVDMSNVDLLRERLATVLQPGIRHVVFEVGGLEFIDSSGLAVLVDVANHVGGAKLRAPTRLVRRVVDITGLGQLLSIEQ